jgi:hypothetical protein
MLCSCLVLSAIVTRKIAYASFGKKISISNQKLGEVLVSQGDAYMLFEMNIVHYPRYMVKYPCHQSIIKIVLTH